MILSCINMQSKPSDGMTEIHIYTKSLIARLHNADFLLLVTGMHLSTSPVLTSRFADSPRFIRDPDPEIIRQLSYDEKSVVIYLKQMISFYLIHSRE